METEVKLCFENKESLFKVADSELFRKFTITAEPVTVTLENYYLDTDDHKILSRNGSVRRRLVSGKDSFIEETVKYGGGPRYWMRFSKAWKTEILRSSALTHLREHLINFNIMRAS